MPQLVRGGKWVFGWSVGRNGEFCIPEAALTEYMFVGGCELKIIQGSSKSGGFGLATEGKLTASKLGTRKVLGTAILDERGCATIPRVILDRLGIQSNAKLLVVRGSGLALGFVAKGPIYEEALRHPEIMTT